jgi:predicted XRE-type DNA-binding protein
MNKPTREFDFKDWFDKEVQGLAKDPEYITYGLAIELAAQIKRKIQTEGINQKDLAVKLNKSESWMSSFMNSPANFSIKELVEVAVALDMEFNASFG